LSRRGVVLSTTAIAALLESRSASASVSSFLCDSTTRAAIRFAAGPAGPEALAASTAALAQEGLRSMLIHKLRLVTLTILLLGAVAAGAGYGALNAFARSREGEPTGEPDAKQARTEPRPLDAPRPAGKSGRGALEPVQPPNRRSPDRDAARTDPIPP